VPQARISTCFVRAKMSSASAPNSPADSDDAAGDHLERVGDGARLLEDFLLHVVVELAQLDGVGAELALDHRPVGRIAFVVDHRVAVQADLDHVAFFEIGHILGHLQQRRGVRCQEVLAQARSFLAHAQQQRRALARADHGVGLAGADGGDRIGAFKLAHRLLDRVEQLQARVHQRMQQMGDDLGVGLRKELVPLGAQLAAQRLVVLDDAVVHHRHLGVHAERCVRVGVDLGDAAVRGPAGVGDAGGRLRVHFVGAGLEVGHATHRAHPLHGPVQQRDASRVVSPVLEFAQAFDQDRNHIALRHGADDATHELLPLGFLDWPLPVLDRDLFRP
jgi:hypothetical protein